MHNFASCFNAEQSRGYINHRTLKDYLKAVRYREFEDSGIADIRRLCTRTTCLCVSKEACGYIMWYNCSVLCPIDVPMSREQCRYRDCRSWPILALLLHACIFYFEFPKPISFVLIPFYLFALQGVIKKQYLYRTKKKSKTFLENQMWQMGPKQGNYKIQSNCF